MAGQQTNRTLKATDVRSQWSQVLNDVFRRHSRVVIEKSGIPVAAIISAEDLTRFEQLDQERTKRFEALTRSWEAFKDMPLEEIEAEVAKAVAEARAELRAERQD